MGIIFKKDETGTPPSHEELQREKNEKVYADIDYGDTKIKHNSDWDKTMTPETTKMLWGVINENTQLQQENYMLKNQLEQIRRLLAE